jgi:hypothetical protein
MNAYFTASVVGKEFHLHKYQKIVDYLKSKNITVQYEHIMQATEATIRMKTKDDRLAFHTQLEKWINTCDFMIVEASFPSISVGYEISMALHRGKPVLILYNEGDPPSLFAYHTDEKLICEKYSLESLPAILDDFINFVEGSEDMRFTFFITSAIAAYLDKVSKKQKLPKSVYLRRLIENEMAKE